jgi:hypothetical protein
VQPSLPFGPTVSTRSACAAVTGWSTGLSQYLCHESSVRIHEHRRPGGAYGKVNLGIPGTQPERDLLCCHIFPDYLAVASNLVVHLYVYIIPLPVFG